MRILASLLVAAAGAAFTAGCASSGAVGVNGRSCTPATVDSTYAALGVVYRNCDVDSPAVAISTNIRPDLQGATALSCMSATVQFVVDEHGHVIPAGATVVRTNLTAFGRMVLDDVPQWTYRPAVKDGVPVRQLVQIKKTVQTSVTRVPVGRAPPTRSGSTIAPEDC